MFLIIYVSLIVIGLFTRNKLKYFDLVVIGFLAVMVYNRTDVADFGNYENVYNYIAAGNVYLSTGVGWYFLCKLGSLIGLSYAGLKAIIIAVGCLLIRVTVNSYVKDEKYRHLVWGLFLLYPVLLDCVQARFFLAEAICVYSARFLSTYKVKNYCLYGVMILCACTIHSSAVMYFAFLLIPLFKRIRKVLIWMIAVLSVLMYAFRNNLVSIASFFIDASRIERYFSSTDSVGLMGIVAYLATLLVLYYVSKKIYEIALGNPELFSPAEIDFFKVVNQMDVIICIVFPLCAFDTNFFRLQRPMWTFLYIVAAVVLEKGIYRIKLMGASVRIRSSTCVLSLLGSIFYIALFTFSVIQSFLL